MKALWGSFGGRCSILTLKLDFRLENGKSFVEHFLCRFALFWYLSIGAEFIRQSLRNFLKLKEDLQMEHILITSKIFLDIFQEKQSSVKSKYHHEHLTVFLPLRKSIYMLFSPSRVANCFYTNGIIKVEHVIHKVVDESESVDFGCDSDRTEPRQSNMGPRGVSK